MGFGSYSHASRSVRATNSAYYTANVDAIFTQNIERKIHADMNPANVKFREACDSPQHPNVVPIQLYLDVTGSMGHIPHEMIKDGLPTLIGHLIQHGIKDVALMFGAIGDHECDRAPLQVAQFESGDAELDMWLTRTWLEGNGGGNAGESYLLAWYFAGHHVRTDAWDKRKTKGFVFTIGDEPCLRNLPVSALRSIMADTAIGQGNFTHDALLAKAQEQNHVYHIHLNHNGHYCDTAWREMLGKNLIELNNYKDVSKAIAETVLSHSVVPAVVPVTADAPAADDGSKNNMML